MNNVSNTLVSVKLIVPKELGTRHAQNEDKQNTKAHAEDTDYWGEKYLGC
jgi:hypothetical protein